MACQHLSDLTGGPTQRLCSCDMVSVFLPVEVVNTDRSRVASGQICYLAPSIPGGGGGGGGTRVSRAGKTYFMLYLIYGVEKLATDGVV